MAERIKGNVPEREGFFIAFFVFQEEERESEGFARREDKRQRLCRAKQNEERGDSAVKPFAARGNEGGRHKPEHHRINKACRSGHDGCEYREPAQKNNRYVYRGIQNRGQ